MPGTRTGAPLRLRGRRTCDIMLGMMMRCVCMMLVSWVAAGAMAAAAVSEAGRSAMEAARSYGAAVRSCDMGWALDFMYPPLKLTYADQFASRNGHERENANRAMGLLKEPTQQAVQRNKAALAALREHYVKMGREMINNGIKIESFTVREPVAEYRVAPPTTMARTVKREVADTQRSNSTGALTSAESLQSSEMSRFVVLPTTIIVSGPAPGGRGTVRVERRSHIYAIRDERVNAVDAHGNTSHGTKLNQWYFVDGNTEINILRNFFPNLPQRLTLPDGGERVIR